jgi:hypothetical protein
MYNDCQEVGMTKRRKTYRLSDETLAQLAWLQDDTGLDATAVVTLALADLFKRRRHARLVKSSDGWWSLMMGEKPIVSIRDKTLELMTKREPDLVAKLQEEGLPTDAALVGFGTLLLLVRACEDDNTNIVVAAEFIEAERRLLGLGGGTGTDSAGKGSGF